jgi:hypothetical protein
MRRIAVIVLLFASVILAIISLLPEIELTPTFFSGRFLSQLTGVTPESVDAGPVDAEPTYSFTHSVPPIIDEEIPLYRFSVPVENATGAQVELRQISRSCTCTNAELRPDRLKPGQKADLEVSVRTLGKSGPQQFSVAFAEKNGRVWHFSIKTTVFTRARFISLDGDIRLPAADPDQRVHKKLILELFAKDRHSLPDAAKIDSPQSGVTVQTGEPSTESILDNLYVRRLPVLIDYQVPSQPGDYDLQLRAKYAMLAEQKSVHAYLSGTVRSVFEVSPQFVYFGASSSTSGPIKRSVEIRRCDGQAIRLGKLTLSPPNAVMVQRRESAAPDRCTLDLSLDSRDLHAPLWGDLCIETGDSRQPTVKLHFAAMPGISDKPADATRH